MKSSYIHFICCISILLASCNAKEDKIEEEENASQNPSVVSYKTGNSDIAMVPLGGVCMMGGRTENDNAMRWFLSRAQGGDVLVLRASGTDGYNDYFFSELGIEINSVETLVFQEKTEDKSIIDKIDLAETIWFAGGDQEKYVAYWKDSAVENALQRAIDRGAVIGGTSAGMAILGEFVWTGEEIVSDFLSIPFLENTITDSHFSERDRMSRLQGFINDTGAKGIAADEYTAICIDTEGLAKVYGEEEEDFAFFISENLEVNQVLGLPDGNNSFDLSAW